VKAIFGWEQTMDYTAIILKADEVKYTPCRMVFPTMELRVLSKIRKDVYG
jgi:hypothetical protein